MKHLTRTLAFASLAALAAPSWAQFAKSEDAIKYRQGALFVMQQNFARVAAMAAGRAAFDGKLAAESAATAEYLARLPWAAFGDGTDKGRETRAKPEIWQDKARFNDYAEKMQMEMAKLSAATKAGTLDAIKPAVASVGNSCKTCHDAFRKD